jgi:hypothetical protein
MTTAVQPLDLLQIDWPTHLVPEILARLLEVDLSAEDEALARRRLVKGSVAPSPEDTRADPDDAEDDLLAFVVRACLTFAGKRRLGPEGSETRATVVKRNDSSAGAWCACAVRVLCRAPSPDHARAYRAIREALIRFPELVTTLLETFEREAAAREDPPFDYGAHAWPFVMLAALSSRAAEDATTQNARHAFGACIRAMSSDDVRAFIERWCGGKEARRDALEVCLALPGDGATRKALPALTSAWPACRAAALDAALWGILDEKTCDVWIGVLESVATEWQGELNDEQARLTAGVASRLQSFVSTSGTRAAARVARSISRVASASGSSACEAAILDQARATLSGPVGDEAICGVLIAGEFARLGKKQAATPLLESGIAHGDARVRSLALKIVDETLGDSALARNSARAAVDFVARIGSGDSASASDEGLAEMTRLALRQTRSPDGADHAVAGELAGALFAAFARAQSETLAAALVASFEVLLDEAVLFPGCVVRYFPSADDGYLVGLVEKHIALTERLTQAPGSCLATLPGCAAMLAATQTSATFHSKHVSHILGIVTRRVRYAMAFDNPRPDLDVEAARAVERCASHASASWRAWMSDAEVADGLSLLKECVAFAAASGDAHQVSELIAVATREEERLSSARALIKRAHSAVGKAKRDAVARVAASSRACGATAVFCEAFLEHFRRAGFDSPDGQRVALGLIDIIGALEPLSSVDASQSAAVVLSASMHAVRDVVFHPRGMPLALSTRAMRVLMAHYRRCTTVSERVMNVSDLLVETVPHVARGVLLDATHALVTTFEADLLRSGGARDLDDDAALDATTAAQEVINAVLIHTRMKRKADSGGAVEDERVRSTIGVPAFASSAVRVARLCLDVARRESASSELACRGGRFATRGRDAPSAPNPPREDLPRGGAVAQRSVLRERGGGQTRVANGCDVWRRKCAGTTTGPSTSTRNPRRRRPPICWDSSRRPADAVGDRPVEGEDPEETKVPKKKKVKRKHRNPFVQALRETEGKKYRSHEWDDLEDFVVCKPGRNYRKLLGLGDRRSISPSRRREDGAPRLRFHERTRELLYEKAKAGTLGEPDMGQFYRGTRNAWYCMKCHSCMNPQNRRKCEVLPADGKPPGYVEDPEDEEAEEEMAEEEMPEGQMHMAEEEMAEEEMPEERARAGEVAN